MLLLPNRPAHMTTEQHCVFSHTNH